MKSNYNNLISFILVSFFMVCSGMTDLFSQKAPMGAINGLFSVSANQQVAFSQGNLQYKASTNTWRFAENQWDFVGSTIVTQGQGPGGNVSGSSNHLISSTYNGWIDLFGWGTSGYNHGAICYQPWSTDNMFESYYYAYGSSTCNLYDQTGQADWGYNPISNGGNQENSGWRTLKKSEWNYLFNVRVTTSGVRFAKARINGVNGVILLPDNWNANCFSLNNINQNTAVFSSNIISASQWVTLEQYGAVFLPTTGYRSSTSIGYVEEWGCYWSSSYYISGGAHYVSIADLHLNAQASGDRRWGYSVRLVRPAQCCSITANSNPPMGGMVSGAGEYVSGADCTLTATTNTGYSFLNWTENGSVVSTNETYSFIVNTDRALVANFIPDSYQITVTANPSVGGTVTGAGTYDYGSSVSLTAVANTGYHFVNWTKNGAPVSENATYSFTVTESGDFVANFSINTYQISVSGNTSAGGVVTGGGTYDHGTTATLTATPSTGYHFVNWTKNGIVVSLNATYSFTVTESGVYMAVFQLNSYQISAAPNPANGGSIIGQGTYSYGVTAYLTAVPNEGYAFVNWTKDGIPVSTDMTYSFTVTESGNYIANFVWNTHQIMTSANPENGGQVLGAGTYNHGVTAVLTAIPNDGFVFVHWTKDGIVVSTIASYSFTVTESGEYVAIFYDITDVDELIANDFRLYPNPTDDLLVIENQCEVDGYEIYTLTGQLVCKESNCQKNLEIKTSSIRSGPYIIRLLSNGKVYTTKFVKR